MLDLKNSKALGIVKTNKEGHSKEGIWTEMVNSLHIQPTTKVLVNGKKQELID